jgi:hypothetical protein
MYSPKINEVFIPILYRLKQQTKKPMTCIVNEAIKKYLTKEVNNEKFLKSKSIKDHIQDCRQDNRSIKKRIIPERRKIKNGFFSSNS